MTDRLDPRPLARLVVLLGLVVGACSPGPTAAPSTSSPPSPTPNAATTPSAAPTPSPAPTPTPGETGPAAAACTALDLKASHGLVEGAAGSRETEVILVTAVACALPASPAFGLRDGGDAAIVAGAPGGSGLIVVQPGSTYASDVRFANWCGAEPDYPLTLELRLAGETLEVTGGPFPEDGDMPPCTDGPTPELIATPWAQRS